MNTRLSRWGMVTSMIVGAMALTLATTPASASQVEPSPAVPTGFYAMVNGEKYVPFRGEVQHSLKQSSARRGVTPLLLDPVDSLQCNVNNNAGHMVTSYQAAAGGGFGGGTIRLLCGTSAGSGYKHIRDRHQADWTRKLTKYGLPGAWDDFMDFATRQSLASPSRATDQGLSKSCYTTPIQILNRNGTVAETFFSRIIISRNNTLVITSFPGGGC